MFTELALFIGSYGSLRWWQKRREAQRPVLSNHRHYIASSALVTATSSVSYFYPPLWWCNVALLSYSNGPIARRAWQEARQKKLRNDGYCTLLTTACVASSNFVAGGLHVLIYHISCHYVDRSREQYRQQQAGLVSQTLWATVQQTDQSFASMPLAQVQQGQILQVTSGQLIPVDGLVVKGHGVLNAQLLTGESALEELSIGQPVSSGTLLMNGNIWLQASQSGQQAQLYQISQQFDQTADFTGQLQLRGEQWANRIALPVLGLSALSWPLLGPSTAVAIFYNVPPTNVRTTLAMTSLRCLQQLQAQGIEVRDARVLERLHHVDVMLLDKTGTLTQALPVVEQIISSSEYSPRQLLQWAASLEQGVEHPVAQGILAHAQQQGVDLLTPDRLDYQLGLGLQGQFAKQIISIGSPVFIAEQLACDLPDPIPMADTLLYLADHEKILGYMALSQVLRPQTTEVIQQLRNSGIRNISVLSGNQQVTVQRTADQLQLDGAYGNHLPQDKARLIAQLQQQGHRVAFVGDGLNDAIAMKQADVAICLGDSGQTARQVAGVILHRNCLQDLLVLKHASSQLQRQLGYGIYFWGGFGISMAGIIPYFGLGALHAGAIYTSAFGGSVYALGRSNKATKALPCADSKP